MDMNNALYQIFKNSNPELSDADIQLAIDKAGQAPDSAKQDVGGMLGLTIDAPSAPSVPNSFDVADSTHTVTQNGSPESLPTQNMSNTTVKAPTMPVEPPTMPSEPSSPVPSTPAPVNPSAVMNKAPVEAPSTPVVEPSDPDAEKRLREADLAAREHKRRMAILPEAIAGVGDAIASGASAFGVNAPKDKQEKLMELAKKNYEESGTLFENRLLNDPNSDASKAYRQMVIQIAPDMAKQPSFQSMSAKMIGDKLPLIDTMMKAQAAKDAKEMGLKSLQANKDISLGLKEDQQQDKLEQQYKQQLMSVRGDPNISGLEKQRDAAAQAYNLLRDSQGKGKDYNLSEPQMVELYGQLYTAMTGRGLTAEAQHAMDQATAKSKMASIATFIGMSPSATTQAIGDRLKHMTTTLGTQVQGNLDKRMESRILPPSGLKSERVEPIKKAGRGYTFQELINQSNKRAVGENSKNDPMGIL